MAKPRYVGSPQPGGRGDGGGGKVGAWLPIPGAASANVLVIQREDRW